MWGNLRWRRVTLIVTMFALLGAVLPFGTRSAFAVQQQRVTTTPQITFVNSPSSTSSSGPAGTTIHLQTLAGAPFDPNTPLTVMVGGTVVGFLTSTQYGSLPSNSFIVPAGGAGPQQVRITETNIPSVSAATLFYVTGSGTYQQLLVSSPNLSSGQQGVTAQDTGFTPNEQVAFTLTPVVGGTSLSLGTVTAGLNGSATLTSFTVPSVAAGDYVIQALGLTSTVHAIASVTIGPGSITLAVAPTAVQAGQQVLLNGCGYAAGETINSTVIASTAPYNLVTSLPVVAAGADGCFNSTVTLPASLANGNYFIQAASNTNVNVGQVTVGNGTTTGVSLTATPNAATPGQSIVVQGSGFSPNATLTLSGLGTAQSILTSTTGSFSLNVTVPSNTALGTYTETAVDSTNRIGTTTVTVSTSTLALLVSTNSAVTGGTVVVTGTGFTANERVDVSLSNSSSTPSAIASTTESFTANAAGSFSGTYTVPSTVAANSYLLLAQGETSRSAALASLAVGLGAATATSTATVITQPAATTTGTPGVVPFPTQAATSSPTPAPLLPVIAAPSTSYFAEGYTGTSANNHKATFTERLFLFNTGTVASAVTTTYYIYNPTNNQRNTVTAHDTVAPGASVVRSVNTDAGNDRFVSIVVNAANGVVAETLIDRVRADGTVLDSESSLGSPALSPTWYLAEGYTGISLQEYITLFNPGGSPATTHVQYLPSDTPAPAAQTVTVPAGGRVTINVRAQYNSLVKQGSRNIGISVTSDQPIALDRSMYWGDGSGSAKYGFSLGPGIASTGQTLNFAFLPTANSSQSFVTVLNPGGTASSLTLNLRDAAGNTLRTVTASVPAGQRHTFVVPSLLPGNFGAVSGILTASTPIVAEAGLYFNGSPNIGRHPGIVVRGSVGSTGGARSRIGSSGGQVYVFNPLTTPVRVQISVSGATGGTSVVFDGLVSGRNSKTVVLPAGSDNRGVLALGSSTFTAVLVNGGDGATIASGGNLN